MKKWKADSDAAPSTKIVIVGAGFGGLEAAKTLSGKNVDVTLIDKHNYHLFQPLLYQVATAALTPAEIASPIRQIVRKAANIRVYMDSVEAVDHRSKTVLMREGAVVPYDFLVLATGARHSYFGKDDWAKTAPGLKTIDDAFALRQRILTAFEKAEMEPDPQKRAKWLTFTIIGAGPTGVELAGAIAELARHSLTSDFHHIKPDTARIILVDGGSQILCRFGARLSAAAKTHLEELGVKVMLNSRVEALGEGYVQTSSDKIACRTIIWAAGVEASPAGKWLDVSTDNKGRIIVRNDLSVEGCEGVYAIGDTASFTPLGAQGPLPGLAPVAKQMGRYVAHKILSECENRSLSEFRYRDHGVMATIGRHKAIANLYGVKLSGAAGWFLWSFAHIYYLVGFRSRFTVSLSWFWSYLTWQRGVRLITGQQESTKAAKTSGRLAA